MEERLELIKPTTDLEAEYRAMAAEFDSPGSGYTVADIPEDFGQFVRRLRDMEHGVGLRPGFVPQTTFWLIEEGGVVVGECRLRHRLTPQLEQRGGHIGYAIRPSRWRRGYGTRILALALEEARRLGLERVLITCYPENIGSARIIEKNGGRRIVDGVDPDNGHSVSRYWIDL